MNYIIIKVIIFKVLILFSNLKVYYYNILLTILEK